MSDNVGNNSESEVFLGAEEAARELKIEWSVIDNRVYFRKKDVDRCVAELLKGE